MAQEPVMQSKIKPISGFHGALKTKEMGVFGALGVLSILM